MTRIAGVSVRGDWPGMVTLRSGWSKAVARPLNDLDRAATLRLERGSADFVRACADRLFELGAPAVWSSPVHNHGRGVWEGAGFSPGRQLLLMERSLARPITEARIAVRTGLIDEAAPIDRQAFDADWQIGRMGLQDALTATVRSRLLVSEPKPVQGFAIVGVTGSTGYLQRIAVAPEHGGRGVGRELLRASMMWARSAGARAMLLNTQPENERAVSLYRSEGFMTLPDRLNVLLATRRTQNDHHR